LSARASHKLSELGRPKQPAHGANKPDVVGGDWLLGVVLRQQARVRAIRGCAAEKAVLEAGPLVCTDVDLG